MSGGIRLDGKVAIVTGAGAGIGFAAARAIAAAGAEVVCADIDSEAAERAVAGIGEAGGKGIAVTCDVAVPDAVSAMVERTVGDCGRLDLAFNNAGILGRMGVPLDRLSVDDWDRMLAVNLSSVFHCMKCQIPAMLANGSGAIVNMASVAGLISAPRNPAYGATKSAVISLSRSAAMQYADRGIRINAVCPGIIKTGFSDSEIREEGLPSFPPPFIPMQRLGTPEEIAAVVVWLLSEQASYLTGEAIGADGGWRHM